MKSRDRTRKGSLFANCFSQVSADVCSFEGHSRFADLVYLVPLERRSEYRWVKLLVIIVRRYLKFSSHNLERVVSPYLSVTGRVIFSDRMIHTREAEVYSTKVKLASSKRERVKTETKSRGTDTEWNRLVTSAGGREVVGLTRDGAEASVTKRIRSGLASRRVKLFELDVESIEQLLAFDRLCRSMRQILLAAGSKTGQRRTSSETRSALCLSSGFRDLDSPNFLFQIVIILFSRSTLALYRLYLSPSVTIPRQASQIMGKGARRWGSQSTHCD